MALLDVLRSQGSSLSINSGRYGRNYDAGDDEMDLLKSEKLLIPNAFDVSVPTGCVLL